MVGGVDSAFGHVWAAFDPTWTLGRSACEQGPHAADEALIEAVLLRLAWSDIISLDTDSVRPDQDRVGTFPSLNAKLLFPGITS